MTTKYTVLAFVVLSFCVTATAQGQHVRADPAKPEVWSMFIGKQMATALVSPSADVRAKALEHVSEDAHARVLEGRFEDRGHGGVGHEIARAGARRLEGVGARLDKHAAREQRVRASPHLDARCEAGHLL